jgi:hypothetical protein
MQGKGYIKPKEELIAAIDKSINMTEASRILGVPFTTFRDWAIKYGIYDPHPQHRKRLSEFASHGLRRHILLYNIKENICERCGLKDVWNGMPINLHVHHKDGNNKNNNIENLEMLCPNCHSQTDNYCGKNVKR